MAGDSDMEISDDDLPPSSSVGSCLHTHPPTHQEAHDFLSSLLLAPDGKGVLPGDGPVDESGASVDTARAGVRPGTHPPPHQEANDFLSSLFLGPEREGVLTGNGTIVAGEAGACLETRPVDAP